jgi:hypothetical protein
MRACADAELRGDPIAAWHHYRQIERFDESLHGERLRLLVELGDEAPGWLWTRWMTIQVRRPLWSGAPDGSKPSPELVRAVEIAYPRGADTDRMDGMSMPMFVASLHERDWLVRQLTVYESGAMRRLTYELAGERLLAHADQPGAWATAPMGGFRLLGDAKGVLRVMDLGSDAEIDLLDLGLGTEHWPGQHFLGRVVPTRVGPGRMFEWRPLPVGKVTARRVAADPDRWLEILAERSRTGTLPSMWSHVGDEEMVADLPVHSWLGLLDHHDIGDLPRRDGLISWDDVAAFALQRLVAMAVHPAMPAAALRHLGRTLLLRPGTDEVVRATLTGRDQEAAWLVLARVLGDPVARRCASYAELAASPAA